MTDRPTTGLNAEASGLVILCALTLFLGTLMVGLPLLRRWML